MTSSSRWLRMPFIPARYFDSLVNLAVPGRRERETLLAAAGLEAGRLDQPENLLNLEEVEGLVARTMEEGLGDDTLALRLGAELNLSAHGTLGLAGLSSATLDEAIRVAVEYFPLVTPLLHPEYHREEHRASLHVRPACHQSDRLYRFLVETMFASLYVQGRFLLEGRIPPVHVWVPFSERIGLYRQRFPELRIESGRARETALVFPAAVMDTPLPLANPAVREQARRECLDMLERLPHPDHPVRTVNWLLRETGTPPDAARVAARMGWSERSLRRHLAERGQSFRELALTARMERARYLLRNKGLSVSETAFHCGYTDTGNFSRAFRKHFGCTPGYCQGTGAGTASS